MKTPELRFPEFQVPWCDATAGEAFANSKAKGETGLPIWSVTQNRGLVPRDSIDRHMEANAADETHLRAQSGDLVYNMMRMWQGAVGQATEECMVSPAYVVLSPKGETSSDFFDYWFNAPRMLYRLWAYSHGLTNDRLRLYYGDFAKIPLALPGPEEQRRIAAFMDAVSEKIALLKREEAALVEYKRGVMEQLFSQKLRFRREDGSAYSAWKWHKLSSVMIEHGEKSDGTEAVFSVAVERGLVDQIEHLGRSYCADSTLNYGRVFPEDIVYTKSPTGKFPYGIVKQSTIGYPVIVSPLYGIFSPKTAEIGGFISIFFESPKNAEKYLRPLVNKGAKNTMNINNRTFLSGKIMMPTEQDEFGKIFAAFSSLNAKIDAVSTQITQMETFKKGLLQKLFV